MADSNGLCFVSSFFFVALHVLISDFILEADFVPLLIYCKSMQQIYSFAWPSRLDRTFSLDHVLKCEIECPFVLVGLVFGLIVCRELFFNTFQAFEKGKKRAISVVIFL